MATTSDRVLSVLALFTDERGEWTVEAAAETLGVPVSTVYRYFRSLSKAELIIADWTGRYVLGPAVLEYDRTMRQHDPLINASDDVMRELGLVVGGDTVAMLARGYKDKVICVHYVRPNGSVIRGYERGRPMPLDRGAASKVILAHLSPRQMRALKLSVSTEKKGFSRELAEELSQIRNSGYAITRGEIDPGVIGISVPIFRSFQQLEGSLSLVVRADRAHEEKGLVAALVRARKAVEANFALSDASSRLDGKQ